jgi:hypothetical protein
VLAREGLLHAGIGVPAAFALPLVTAGGKLAGQKHWASDVVGGYLGALAVAGRLPRGVRARRGRPRAAAAAPAAALGAARPGRPAPPPGGAR